MHMMVGCYRCTLFVAGDSNTMKIINFNENDLFSDLYERRNADSSGKIKENP